ncbi:cell cycle progression protein 1-like isoform X1 [Oncorhynchus keta]|uniref:cell cycle progression protein 1-like isoform X1 n=1 Tax=Oncorhynchus keta TaxID=8018 RepID=UPI0015F9B670|nr:cell cycle progression protein 1-like isoform X1 [Oncorhynchus keta]XP_052337982.1 cell cycle progression protein 1-like isoform X1 [Oncorhynchus keta]XP_052337984.1 cell cycle progression protein 1-like isoform X1 [Oncorhynchus keta]
MSESSSDTESSCGWTIISNEGSDIEALGPENGLECGSDLPESVVLEPELLQDQLTALSAEFTEERGESSLNATLKEETLDEILFASEAGGEVAGDEQVTLCSSSDHSDIVTLGDTRETELGPWDEQAVEEGAVSEELYLGTSSSSQYTFSAAETARLMMGHWKLPQSLWDLGCQLKGQMSGSCPLSVFPAEQPVVADSSSSEDEGGEQVTPVVRRRRVRKSTTSSVAEPGEEVQESGHIDREETLEEEQKEVQEEVQQEPRVAPPPQGHVSSTLNKCIILALIIAISMGIGHFYGTVQVQDRQKIVEKICGVNDLSNLRALQPQCHKGPNVINKDVVKSLREDLKDKSDMMLSLTGIMDKLTKENQDLRSKQAQLQAQKEDLVVKLKQTGEERVKIESKQSHLMVENQLLKSSLEREEESLSTLQEELRNLRSQIRELEETGAGADSILSENQRLKDHLEEETQRLRSFLSQREALMAEAQTLRRELDNERRVTDQLREQLSSRNTRAGGEVDPETEELQSRLMELQKKLSFEQQRSDLWERLYVETKEERAKGDKQAKVKRSKDGVIGKVKDTFDAVKNSTKEFVHHHKEQITKAKEAVKENLRKFSDSVKSTFRHFKDSASRMMDKTYRPHDRRFHERKEAKTEQQEHHRDHGNKDSEEEPWQPRTHKPLHRHPRKSTDDSFQAHRNTRKSGGKVEEDPEAEQQQREVPKGCSGVFDCAYQESMSLFNKAMDPIRADEFNQLLHSYLQQEVDHFHHWTELESFIKNFFHNGVFIHDQMLFTDFVSGVEDYLEDMDEYHGHNDDVFEDLDEYVYRHFFGDTYSKRYGSSRPFEVPNTDTKEERLAKHQQRNQRARPRSQRERKWSRAGRNTDRHMADVKIELGPMPFDPKY